MSLEPGELVEGKYRIVKLIGEGGMGSVYEGENVRIRRRVAIKVLHVAFTANAEVISRFEREAQAAGRIGNDHILEVLDMGSLPNGDHFMVMEFLDGETLSDRIKRLARITPVDLAPLARQMLAGLAAAHAAGIVHRDLKPDNVFILREKAGKRDYVKIIDFGISKFQPLAGDGMKMTRTGAVMGTPYYMSPEQASGTSEADARSDLYSVAVMLYEAVTGRVPFDGNTFNQLMFKIVLSESPPPQSIVPDLDAAFCSIISKGMARDVGYRFQTAERFIQALDAWVQSGAAVTIPPAVPATGLIPQTAPHALTAAGPGLDARGAAIPTAGSWASSQADLIPKKGAAGTIALLAALAVVFVVGGAFAVFKLVGKKDVPAAAASAAGFEANPPSGSAKGATGRSNIQEHKEPAAPSVSAEGLKPEHPKAEPPVATSGGAKQIVESKKVPSKGALKSTPPKQPSSKPAPKPGAKVSKPAGAPDFGY